MNPMQQAMTALEQELDALDQRRGEIERAIHGLRPFVDGPAVPKGRAVQKIRKEELRRVPGDAGEAILAALRIKSPQSPGELATRLQLHRPRVTDQINALSAAGKVECTGATMNRQVHLLPRVAAKEEP